MSQLQIKLADSKTRFSPGETVQGTVAWQLDAPPEKVELDLLWSTRGKGTTDIEIVQSIPFAHALAQDTRSFAIKLPDSPYTFSGQLISLIWNLELNIGPGDRCEALEITVAPDGREVLLPRIQPDDAR